MARGDHGEGTTEGEEIESVHRFTIHPFFYLL